MQHKRALALLAVSGALATYPIVSMTSVLDLASFLSNRAIEQISERLPVRTVKADDFTPELPDLSQLLGNLVADIRADIDPPFRHSSPPGGGDGAGTSSQGQNGGGGGPGGGYFGNGLTRRPGTLPVGFTVGRRGELPEVERIVSNSPAPIEKPAADGPGDDARGSDPLADPPAPVQVLAVAGPLADPVSEPGVLALLGAALAAAGFVRRRRWSARASVF